MFNKKFKNKLWNFMVDTLSPPQRLLLAAMITISIEIHFTKLYMTDLGTRAEPLGEGAQEEWLTRMRIAPILLLTGQ